MTTGTVETYPIGIRGYQFSPPPGEIEHITERGRPAVWVVQPLRPDECRMYFATEAEAQQCLAGVREALG